MITPSLTQEITALHADICSALADPNRILILYALKERPCNVNSLAEELGISQSAASRHLNLLRERGIVYSKRDGQSVINYLTDERIIDTAKRPLFFAEQPVRNWSTARLCDTSRFSRFFWGLLERGIYLPCSQFEAMFVSAAHTVEHIDATVSAAQQVLAELAAPGPG